MRNGKYELVVAPAGFPGKKYRGRYAYEHRVAYWIANGKLEEVVHHKNESKRDNLPENLEGMDRSKHTAMHNEVPHVDLECGWCGDSFSLLPSQVKTRLEQSKSGLLFCSRSCGTKNQFSGR